MDEFSHMWNRVHGKGKYLPDDLAKTHKNMAAESKVNGTHGFIKEQNTLYHQLEFMNMFNSNNLPSLIRAVPTGGENGIKALLYQTRHLADELGYL